MRQATIQAIEYYLPSHSLSNQDLAAQFPDWDMERLGKKVGITQRRLADSQECSSDLAVIVAQRLLESGIIAPEAIDFLMLCTQSPDYFLPTTACLIQDRLGLPITIGALDFNLGCSGFVYGLGMAKGLIETGQAQNILLLTAETYSKFLRPDDRNVVAIFGDAAAATLVSAVDLPASEPPAMGPFVYGTDGSGAETLIVKRGGFRSPYTAQSQPEEFGDEEAFLFMDGRRIFTFTIKIVPEAIERLLMQTGLSLEAIDLFVFHQANGYMLQSLRKRLEIPAEKFFIFMENCGNTVSSTIPIALKEAEQAGVLKPGMRVMLVGFGVGLSWAASMITWKPRAVEVKV